MNLILNMYLHGLEKLDVSNSIAQSKIEETTQNEAILTIKLVDQQNKQVSKSYDVTIVHGESKEHRTCYNGLLIHKVKITCSDIMLLKCYVWDDKNTPIEIIREYTFVKKTSPKIVEKYTINENVSKKKLQSEDKFKISLKKSNKLDYRKSQTVSKIEQVSQYEQLVTVKLVDSENQQVTKPYEITIKYGEHTENITCKNGLLVHLVRFTTFGLQTLKCYTIDDDGTEREIISEFVDIDYENSQQSTKSEFETVSVHLDCNPIDTFVEQFNKCIKDTQIKSSYQSMSNMSLYFDVRNSGPLFKDRRDVMQELKKQSKDVAYVILVGLAYNPTYRWWGEQEENFPPVFYLAITNEKKLDMERYGKLNEEQLQKIANFLKEKSTN